MSETNYCRPDILDLIEEAKKMIETTHKGYIIVLTHLVEGYTKWDENDEPQDEEVSDLLVSIAPSSEFIKQAEEHGAYPIKGPEIDSISYIDEEDAYHDAVELTKNFPSLVFICRDSFSNNVGPAVILGQSAH